MSQQISNAWGTGVAGLGAFLKAVYRAAHGPTDPRLLAALGGNEAIPAEGGFLVPSEFSTILFDGIRNETSVAPLCTALPPLSKGNRVVMPAIDETSRANGSRWGGIVSAWQTEASAISPSKGKFSSVELILGKLVAAVFATEEMIEDAAVFGKFMELSFGPKARFVWMKQLSEAAAQVNHWAF